MTNVPFPKVPLNTIFYYNQTTYQKVSTRTAIALAYNRVFYFTRDTVVKVASI